MKVIVYKYGIHAPHEGAGELAKMFDAAWQMRREITRVRNDLRRARHEFTDKHPDVAPFVAAAVLAREAFLLAHATVQTERERRGTRKLTKATREQYNALKQDFRAKRMALFAARAALLKTPTAAALKDQWAEARNARIRQSRADQAVADQYAYFVKEASAQSESTRPPYDWDGLCPLFLKSRARADGGTTGCVGMCIRNGGISLADLVAGKFPAIRFTLPPETAWLAPTRAERRRDRRLGRLSVRLSCKPNLWASFVVDMHRPLPEDARIKWVTVRRRQVGPHARWELTLTVETDRQLATPDRRTGSACAVSIERPVERRDGLLVATWHGSDGCGGDIVLSSIRQGASPSMLDSLREPGAIRSARDVRFNVARDAFADESESWGAVPDILQDDLKSIRQWRSPGRLAVLCHRLRGWMDAQKKVDPAIVDSYNRLASWQARDRHEWACETRRSLRARRRRREQYRMLGAQLASRYETIVLQDGPLTRKKQATDDERHDANEAARSRAAIASPGELCDSIRLTAASRGAIIRYLPPENRSGGGRGGGELEEVEHVSSSAQFMLERYLLEPHEASATRTSSKTKKVRKDMLPGESRQQYVARKKVERAARIDAAREPSDKAAE